MTVLVYGIQKPGENHVACTLDPKEFLKMVQEFMDADGVVEHVRD